MLILNPAAVPRATDANGKPAQIYQDNAEIDEDKSDAEIIAACAVIGHALGRDGNRGEPHESKEDKLHVCDE